MARSPLGMLLLLAQLVAVVVVAVGLVGLVAGAEAVRTNKVAQRVVMGQRVAMAQRIVIIGIDGLAGDLLPFATAPTLAALAANGTATLQCQNVLGSSSSQNWYSMIGGASPDQHKIYTNAWEPGDSTPTPSIFAVWREQRPNATIAAIYHWSGFGRMLEPGVCDLSVSPGDATATTDAAVAYIKSDQPDLLFVHLDLVDGAGHGEGWGSEAYYAAIAEADALAARILAALAEAGVLDETAIFVSSDHGGTRAGTHGADRSQLRNIPFIAAGAGIVPAQTITREVRIFDIAATVAEVAGLDRPASWIASPVYEALVGYVPAPAPTAPLEVTYTTSYTFLYDTTDEVNIVLQPFSVWRPVAPAGYVALGDVAVRGYDAPEFATPVVRDTPEVLAPPAAFERIWSNTQFFNYRWPVTFWQPIPTFGYTCVGSHSVLTLPSDREPDRDGFRCVHSSYLRQAADAECVGRNAGFSTLEFGWWVSLWTPVAPANQTEGVNANSFIVRRDLDGPGFNKFFYLDL